MASARWLAALAPVALLACRGLLEIEEKTLIAADSTAPPAAAPDASVEASAILPDGGSCGASRVVCEGACVDVSTDEANCGRCGRVCSSCDEGKCVAQRVGELGTIPDSIAVSGGFLFWDTSEPQPRIRRSTLTGEDVRTLAATAVGPLGLTIAEPWVYWSTTSGSLGRAPTDGGAPASLANGLGTLGYIAHDAAFVYFTREVDAGEVRRVAFDGTGGTTLVASGVFKPRRIAVDDTDVYFSAAGPDHGIWRADKAGTKKTRIYEGETAGLAMDKTYVFTNDVTQQTILRIAKQGGEVTILASDQLAGGLDGDAPTLYWTSASGTVFRVRKTGGPLESIGIAHKDGTAITARDSKRVYWIAGQAIYTVPK